MCTYSTSIFWICYQLLASSIKFYKKKRKEPVKTSHIQINDTTALKNLLKMRETKNQLLLELSTEIWGYFAWAEIEITTEYLLSVLDHQANQASREKKGLSK